MGIVLMPEKPVNPDKDNKTTDRRFTHNKLVKYIQDLIKTGRLQQLILGADSEKELYTALGIGKTSWFALKKEITELHELTIRTRHETFIQLKGAMMKRAMGYDYEETEQEMILDPRTGAQSKGKVRKVTRHVPPDLSAQKLLIANLKKSECREETGDKDTELANWTNSTETIEIKAESSVTVAVDEAIQNVLKDINNDK